MPANPAKVAPRWLHWWALITLLAAVPLLLLGEEVTTKGVGMVDAQGLRSPWYFFEEYLKDRGLDWKIEHGHRQAGWIIGMCVIALTILTWWKEPRRWVRWLSLLALLAVCCQGLLGIFRIELNALFDKTLALIHGWFAELVFALLATLFVVTSRRWQAESPLPTTETSGLRRWAFITLGLVYGQLLLGGLVRHKDFSFAARSHVLGAFVVVAAVVWLVKLALACEQCRLLKRSLRLLVFLLILQIPLGMETWLSKFFVPQAYWNQVQPLALHQDLVRSIHYVVGTLLLASTLAVTLNVYRWTTNGLLLTKVTPSSGEAA